jgi:uncharacterized membrane protein
LFSIIFGLGAALFWGAGDFAGGLTSRRVGAVRATLYVEAVGLFPLFFIVIYTGQAGTMTITDWIWCGAAGLIGSMGLLALNRALAEGHMSIVASVAALTSASLPVLVGGLRDGWPSVITLAGFGLALLATWLISQTGFEKKTIQIRFGDLVLPFLAGLGFGSYYILINQGSRTSIFAPLLAVRVTGTIALLIFAFLKKQLDFPSRVVWPLVIINTVFDIGGSLFYVLAGQAGRMDIAALLGSLYSVATVLLAWLVLREKISRTQWMGILLSGVAIVLLTY